MMQTKGPDVHASVNQHVFAMLNQLNAARSEMCSDTDFQLLLSLTFQLFTSIRDWCHVLYVRERHVPRVTVC